MTTTHFDDLTAIDCPPGELDATAFASFVPGACDWRDSLVMRPGYEGE